MLNIRVTNRMSHEDFVGVSQASPYILPKRHLISVTVTAVLCAALVLPMPSTWQRFFADTPASDLGSQAYLNEDPRSITVDDTIVAHNENYDDYDIPSSAFTQGNLAGGGVSNLEDDPITAQADADADADSDVGANAALEPAAQPPSTDEQLAVHEPSVTTPAGSWQDGTLAALPAEDNEHVAATEQALAHASNTVPAKSLSAGASAERSKVQAGTIAQPQPAGGGGTTGVSLAQEPEPHSTLTEFEAPQEPQKGVGLAMARPQGKWYKTKVESGDSFASIFSQLGLPYATLNRITKVASEPELMLKVGDPIYFLIDSENVVLELVKPVTATQQVRFTRANASADFTAIHEDAGLHLLAVTDEQGKALQEGATLQQGATTSDITSALAALPTAETMPLAAAKMAERERQAKLLAEKKAAQAARDKANNVNLNRPRLVINEVHKGETFARAGHRAGLTPSEIKTIEHIFAAKFKTAQMQPGDSFRVLFDGIGTKALISAVSLQTSQGTFESFMNPEDHNYYGENEFTPTAGIFRRFPLAGEIKVNSQFNPHRRHPVTKRIAPHNGVDFKAKIGTPVYAPADGEVTFSGYQRAAGYYVIIKHQSNYSTVYMHLSKSEVKRGQQVTVGQIIARTGNTGRTTGPHLHYEIRVNDRPVNPLKVKLPTTTHPNLAREQREMFANNVKILRQDLNNDQLAQVSAK